MQSRRRGHGSSGELDVFGATSYFAGLPPAPAPGDHCRRSSVTDPSSADRLCFQANKVERDDTTSVTRRGPPHQHQLAGWHDHASERHATGKLQLQVVAAKRQPSGKSKLAALLSFMVSPSPRASFRKENNRQEAPPSSTRLLRQAEAARGDEPEPGTNDYRATGSPSSSSRESSAQLQGLFGAHNDDNDDDELDLGVATGDKRLQGITVVRGGGGEERWVVRCCVPGGGGAWDDEELVVGVEQNIKDELVGVEQEAGDDDVDDDGDGSGGNIIDDPAHSWDSDSSSDLFDLDLEHR